jgi:hypothetical protein
MLEGRNSVAHINMKSIEHHGKTHVEAAFVLVTTLVEVSYQLDTLGGSIVRRVCRNAKHAISGDLTPVAGLQKKSSLGLKNRNW